MKLDVRIHGRGGQGVVTAAELLSLAAFDQGLHAQALPSFGSERTGAPVVAFCRIDDRPIRAHDPVSAPDLVVVQDPTLLHGDEVLHGLAADGLVIVNSSRTVAELESAGLRLRPGQHALTVPATDLAREHLGRAMPNTALLGAVAGATGVVSLHAVRRAIAERFDARGRLLVAANLRLAEDAHDLVVAEWEARRA